MGAKPTEKPPRRLGYGTVPPGYSPLPRDDPEAQLQSAPPGYAEHNFEPILGVWKEPIYDRLSFVRKVYGILSIQICLTTLMGIVAMYYKPYRNWLFSHQWTIWIAFAVGMVSCLSSPAVSQMSRRAQYSNLGLFTTAMAYMVSFSAAASDPATVVLALSITLAIFFGLTLFTLQSRINFDSWAPYLAGGLWILLIAGLATMFFPYSSTTQVVMGFAGAALFSGYIMYDTYLVMKRLKRGQEVLAAMTLYLDVVNLFLSILRILNNSQD